MSSQGGNSLTPEPPFPRGNGRTIKRRARHAAQRQARDIEQKEQTINSVMEQLMNSVRNTQLSKIYNSEWQAANLMHDFHSARPLEKRVFPNTPLDHNSPQAGAAGAIAVLPH